MSLGKKDLLEKKSIVVKCALMCAFTILVKKIVPVLYTSIVPVL
jgi:hypothetical protein